MSMNDIQLGSVPADKDQRNAVHVAIVPMIAAELLRPGQRVGLVNGGAGPSDSVLGIVDPYLTDVVPKGTRFWLCLLPNTVTGMRHHWTHPSFDHADTSRNAKSEQWLRQFASTADCPDYETLLAAASGKSIECVDPVYYDTYTIDDQYLFFSGRDAHGPIPAEFWRHVENITGQPCSHKPREFSCSC